MESLDRAAVLARVRECHPSFSDKQLKAVIGTSPSLRGRRTKSGRGSAFVYPAELADAAIAYASAAGSGKGMRSSERRGIVAWLARPHVAASENRAMIESSLSPFLEALGTSGLLSTSVAGRDEAVQRFLQQCSTEQDRDVVRIVTDLIVKGNAMLAPGAAIAQLQRNRLNLSGTEQGENDRDCLLEHLTLSLPGVFQDLPETVNALSNEQIESTRVVTAKLFNMVSFLLDDRFDAVARHGEFYRTFETSELYESWNVATRILAFVLFAMVRPFTKNYFDSVVQMLPATVAMLTVIRTQWPLEEEFAEVLRMDVPALAP